MSIHPKKERRISEHLKQLTKVFNDDPEVLDILKYLKTMAMVGDVRAAWEIHTAYNRLGRKEICKKFLTT